MLIPFLLDMNVRHFTGTGVMERRLAQTQAQ
jgi:hypothetical protein